MTFRVKLLMCVVLIAVIALSVTCANAQEDRERQDYTEAILLETIEALDSYLNKYPKGKYTERARIHKAELVLDLARRLKDKAVSEDILRQGPGKQFRLEVQKLGSKNYILWRSLTSTERGRIQFEPAPEGFITSAISGSGVRDWPPELAKAAGATNFPFIRLRGEVISSGSLMRLLEGDDLIMPVRISAGKMPIESALPPMGSGSGHIYKGDVKMFGLIFKGDPINPLRFAIDKTGAYVHIGGKGSVTTANGRVILSTEK